MPAAAMVVRDGFSGWAGPTAGAIEGGGGCGSAGGAAGQQRHAGEPCSWELALCMWFKSPAALLARAYFARGQRRSYTGCSARRWPPARRGCCSTCSDSKLPLWGAPAPPPPPPLLLNRSRGWQRASRGCSPRRPSTPASLAPPRRSAASRQSGKRSRPAPRLRLSRTSNLYKDAGPK